MTKVNKVYVLYKEILRVECLCIVRAIDKNRLQKDLQALNNRYNTDEYMTYTRYWSMRKRIEDEMVICEYNAEKALVSVYSKIIQALISKGDDTTKYVKDKMKALAQCKRWKRTLRRRNLLNDKGEIVCQSNTNQQKMHLTT